MIALSQEQEFKTHDINEKTVTEDIKMTQSTAGPGEEDIILETSKFQD